MSMKGDSYQKLIQLKIRRGQLLTINTIVNLDRDSYRKLKQLKIRKGQLSKIITIKFVTLVALS